VTILVWQSIVPDCCTLSILEVSLTTSCGVPCVILTDNHPGYLASSWSCPARIRRGPVLPEER